ncbi:hypothetical protein CHS0354_024017 [Potamilus streckersoni]|uniref:inositol-phosphate phosphatase n=1 Tax=Potamilus streckersoni TaxID=2493646 RepID=A0AAE0RZN6_9BIVA|nr:hypothetical protein CHS0354_024017 [Potamilus streckersoni]
MSSIELSIAINAARYAGNFALENIQKIKYEDIQEKQAFDFVTFVDRSCEMIIRKEIEAAFPNDIVVGEEYGGTRVHGKRSWIVDPLDGTLNYIRGFPLFAVSIGLISEKGDLIVGVIYLPIQNEMYTAELGKGAFMNDKKIQVSRNSESNSRLVATGFPFKDEMNLMKSTEMLKNVLKECAGVRAPGSAAVHLAFVACGRLDAFWEHGINSWDIAAGALLVAEANGKISDYSGMWKKTACVLTGILIITSSFFAQESNKNRRKVKESLKVEKKKNQKSEKNNEKPIRSSKEIAQDDLAMAIAAYRTKQYDIATKALQSFKSYTGNDIAEGKRYAGLIEAKILFATRKEAEAEKVLKLLQSDFEIEKNVLNEIFFDYGVLDIYNKKYEHAVGKFARVLESDTISVLRQKSLLYFKLATQLVSIPFLLNMFKISTNMDVRIALMEVFLIRPLTDEQKPLLKSLLRNFAYTGNDSSLSPKLDKLVTALDNKMSAYQPSNILSLGCIFPLVFDMFEGTFNYDLGMQIMNGAIEAIIEFNKKRDSPQIVELHFERMYSGMAKEELLLAIDKFVNEEKVDIVYGPMYSQDAFIVADYLKNKKIVAVSPTATDEKLAENFPNLFLINSTFFERGKIVARFLLNEFKNFEPPLRFAVVFQEEDAISKEMAHGFKDEIKKANQSIAWTVKLPIDFTSMKKHIDSLNIHFDELNGYDTTYFDAIYVPIPDMKKGIIVLSQLSLYSIVGQIVAPGDWGKSHILKKYAELMKGLVYVTDLSVQKSEFTRSIKLRFVEKYGTQPDDFYWVGYGTLTFLAETIQKKNMLNDKLQAALMLKNAETFNALYRAIHFNGTNVNQKMNILEYNEAELNTLERHFPNNPIMPGVLIIEAMAQACCAMFLTEHINASSPLNPNEEKLTLFMGIDKARFRKPVLPGDQLIIDASAKSRKRHVCQAECFLTGLHKSPYHGFSVEFSEYRQYSKGDEPKRIDWKVFARTGKYYIKRFEQETNLRAYIFLDISKSMHYRSDPKFVTKAEYAAYLAASLMLLLLKQKDAVGLVTFHSKTETTLLPSLRESHQTEMLKIIAQSMINSRSDPERKTNFSNALIPFIRQMHPRSLSIIISDCWENPEHAIPTLKLFRHKQNEAIVFHILDPREKDLDLHGNARKEFIDLETKQNRTEQNTTEHNRTEQNRTEQNIGGARTNVLILLLLSLTLYASDCNTPSPTYTITFNSNKGSDVENITVTSGNTANKPKDPIRSGYSFDGWYKDEFLTYVFDFNTEKITANITLYAKWARVKPASSSSNVTATVVSYSQIDLAWTATENTDTFVVYDNGTKIAKIATPTVKYSHTDLEPNSLHRYTIQACNSGGCSASSDEKTATTNVFPTITTTVHPKDTGVRDRYGVFKLSATDAIKMYQLGVVKNGDPAPTATDFDNGHPIYINLSTTEVYTIVANNLKDAPILTWMKGGRTGTLPTNVVNEPFNNNDTIRNIVADESATGTDRWVERSLLKPSGNYTLFGRYKSIVTKLVDFTTDATYAVENDANKDPELIDPSLKTISISISGLPRMISGLPPDDFGLAPDDFGLAPDDFGLAPDDFGLALDDFGLAPDDFGLAPDDFGLAPDDFGLAPDAIVYQEFIILKLIIII